MRQTRLIFVGGFLGAGKTTLLAEAAQRLAQRGHRVGLITNDQAPSLVDSAMLTRHGVGLREVAGHCVCNDPDALLAGARSLRDEGGADIVLCEPVGSCTDLSAAIVKPLRERCADELVVAPLTVLVDPHRLVEVATEGARSRFHRGTTYIFTKQLEEADLIVLTKTDTVDEDALTDVEHRIGALFPEAARKRICALRGDGIDDWLDAVLASTESDTPQRMLDLDYETYAEGEAALGWLNATAALETSNDLDWAAWALTFLERMHAELGNNEAEVGHVKLLLTADDEYCAANLTRTAGDVCVRGSLAPGRTRVALTLNARAQTAPDVLESLVRRLLAEAGPTTPTVDGLQCLSPARAQTDGRSAPV